MRDRNRRTQRSGCGNTHSQIRSFQPRRHRRTCAVLRAYCCSAARNPQRAAEAIDGKTLVARAMAGTETLLGMAALSFSETKNMKSLTQSNPKWPLAGAWPEPARLGNRPRSTTARQIAGALSARGWCSVAAGFGSMGPCGPRLAPFALHRRQNRPARRRCEGGNVYENGSAVNWPALIPLSP